VTRASADDEASVAERETVVAPGGGGPDFPSFPNYEVVGVVGSGGMGVVYKARQKGLDRLVALKVLRPGVAESPEGLRRFLLEARAAARLQHPHIVPIHEVSSAEGRPFFSMDYIEGEPLSEALKDPARTARDSAEILRKVALAVHHAHTQGLIHRDLKPGNILLDRNGEPRVTDFGIAKDVRSDSRITDSGAALGTPCYMAPEQARGEAERIGPPTDVYALGAVLYECLTRQPPFAARTVAETIQKVLIETPRPPRSLAPSAPPALEAIALRALEKSPEARYSSALAFAEDLDRYLRGQSVSAEKGRRTLLAAGAVALLAAALAVVLALPRSGPPGPSASAAGQLAERIRRNPADRKKAAAALLELGAEGIAEWRTLLRDEDSEVRWRAAEALGDLRAREAVGDLVRALRDPDGVVARRAAEALADLGAGEAASEGVALLESPDAAVRRRASRLLGKLKARESAPAIVRLLESEDSGVRESAAATLGLLGAPEAIPALLKRFEDEDTDVREAAIGAIVELGARDAVPRILALLRDEDAAIREYAASALGKLAAQEAVPDLIRLAREDASAGVRAAAAQALDQLGADPSRRPK
jgi:HEAT repeat protein/predicted Ser/Thr protein kinase